jgi:mannose-1-phosphate guanylyltransferase/mannose-6-phosphate isomerase
VILAGGSGTRFWPLSRHLYPKQLLRIIGDHTLIQQTMQRVLGCAPADHVLISTNPGQLDSMRVQLADWKDALKDNFLVEPIGRNTAPAIALAAYELLQRDPDAIMLVVPADHVVKGAKAFQAAVALGAALASRDYLVTFGIKPTRPETGYGYIQPKLETILLKKGSLAGHPVARFVEKPDKVKAAQYLRSGNYFWNSGMFIWRAATILNELKEHQPAVAEAMPAIYRRLA